MARDTSGSISRDCGRFVDHPRGGLCSGMGEIRHGLLRGIEQEGHIVVPIRFPLSPLWVHPAQTARTVTFHDLVRVRPYFCLLLPRFWPPTFEPSYHVFNTFIRDFDPRSIIDLLGIEMFQDWLQVAAFKNLLKVFIASALGPR